MIWSRKYGNVLITTLRLDLNLFYKHVKFVLKKNILNLINCYLMVFNIMYNKFMTVS